jgi:predicted membrane metal-binding protein
LFGIVALVAPRILAPLNRIWLRFGLALHWIVNPVIMAVLYYLAVVPTGLIVRLTGKDLLRLKKDTGAASHWVRREPPGPEPGSMTKQY